MAIYRLSVSVANKSDGARAGARARYVLRQGQYRHASAELVDSYHLNMPAWAQSDVLNYWDAADENERSNGVLFRQIILALPAGPFTPEEHEAMTRELLAAIIPADENLPVTVAIHRGGPDGHNPHAHIMISERVNDGMARTPGTWFKRHDAERSSTGARKSTQLRQKQWLLDTRAAWETVINRHLEGRDMATVTRKSWVARMVERAAAGETDIDLPPSHVQGVIKRIIDRGGEVRSNALLHEMRRAMREVEKFQMVLNARLAEIEREKAIAAAREEQRRKDEIREAEETAALEYVKGILDTITRERREAESAKAEFFAWIEAEAKRNSEAENVPEPIKPAPASDVNPVAAVVKDAAVIQMMESDGISDDAIVQLLVDDQWGEERIEAAMVEADWDDDRIWQTLDPEDYDRCHEEPEPEPPRHNPGFFM